MSSGHYTISDLRGSLLILTDHIEYVLSLVRQNSKISSQGNCDDHPQKDTIAALIMRTTSNAVHMVRALAATADMIDEPEMS